MYFVADQLRNLCILFNHDTFGQLRTAYLEDTLSLHIYVLHYCVHDLSILAD